jgi:4'-phosphopantetheinyl transferase
MLGRTLPRWDETQNSPDLKGGEIHVWRGSLNGNQRTLPVLHRTLAQEEQAKSCQFRLERDRNRYIFAHGVLRTILAGYMGSRPRELVFRYGPSGKPELASTTIRFSISHAEDLVLCAVSRAGEVGVDVERVRPGVEVVARYLCSPRVWGVLEKLPRSASRRTFFRAWTRMEARVKAGGNGLASEPSVFEGFLDACDSAFPVRPRIRGQHDRWWLHDLSPRKGYVAALAARGRKPKLRYWAWRP